jgi:predicted ArsR family transcriptional regulator
MGSAEHPRTTRTLSGVTRVAVLNTLTAAGTPLTVQQISERVGLHTNTVRFHLTQLMRAELVREDQADPSGPGRPRNVYSRAPETSGEPEKGYQLLAEILAGHLAATSPAPAAAATAAGQEWGRHLTERPAPFAHVTSEQAIEQIMTFLDQLGFAPELEHEGHRILLRACPFRAVADHRPDVVCSVHLGLMRGALAEMGAPIEVTDLTPSRAPHPCIAILSERDTDEE